MTKPEASTTGELALSPDNCRAQLDRILASSDFEATARENRFLRYVTEETLAGRYSRIKAYSIAVEVFGRDASFDPQKDPIVRIEAGHLRRSLERYYLTAGQSDPIIITIPKGAYIPTFTARALIEPVGKVAQPSVTAKPLWSSNSWLTAAALVVILAVVAVLALRGTMDGIGRPSGPEVPRVLVERLDDLSKTGNSAAIAAGLTQEIVGQLAKFHDIVVMVSTEKTAGANTTLPRFVLSGSVSLLPDAFRLRVQLINHKDGSVIWADDYDGKMEVADLVAAQADVARNVATSLAQAYGVIFQADSALKVANPPDDWAAYACTLSYYAYRNSVEAKALPAVQACLEEAVAHFPDYATGWSLLSQVYIDEVRFRYPNNPISSREGIARSLEAARKAVELDPLNVRGLQAEMFGLYFSNDIPGALAVGKRAMEINPNDTELMGEYGYRLSLSGDWAAGCPLVQEARERNPGPSVYYETALALCQLFTGEPHEASKWMKRNIIPNNPNYHAIAAAIYGRAGMTDDAAREYLWLQQNAPGLLQNVRKEVALRFGSPKDVEFFLTSLKMAGIDTGE